MHSTLAELIDNHSVDVLDHLDRDQLVPVHTGLQFQGDVAVIPTHLAGMRSNDAASPVPRAGVAVVRGENGGNTHLLLAEGPVFFDGRDPSVRDLGLGTLTVREGGTAWLAHPEHGYMGVGCGTYTLRRQREQADELRILAD